MSLLMHLLGRRHFLATATVGSGLLVPAVAHAASPGRALLSLGSAAAAATPTVRPFRFRAPEAALTDLKRRIAATKWPSQELVPDAAQGVKLATMRKLAAYWEKNHDWRKVEARLNAYPQFITEIDGVDIHFIHVRSKHANALPVIITHGWPGSIIEQMKVIGPLTDPTSFGGTAADAFDVVIPSLPGHGFSGKPTELGWDPIRIARAWIMLMLHATFDHAGPAGATATGLAAIGHGQAQTQCGVQHRLAVFNGKLNITGGDGNLMGHDVFRLNRPAMVADPPGPRPCAQRILEAR